MLRENGFNPKTKTVNFLLLDGGLGDHVASLVAVDYVIKKYTWVTPLVWVPDYLVDFAKNVLPEYGAAVFSFTQMRGLYQPSRPTKTTQWEGHVSAMKIHCVDFAFLRLCDEIPALEHKNYLQVKLDKIKMEPLDLPEKYVVITCGYTAKAREFPAPEINKIVAHAKSKGLGAVFLGQNVTKTGANHIIEGKFSEEINYSAGLNLIDKTSLLEAASIMSGAVAVLGVDNGLLHLAGCTQAPIIGGFTTVSPEIRMPIRNSVLGYNYYPVVPDAALSCKFCQQNTNFLYGHDYRNCIYKDNLCTKQMTAEKFIKALEKVCQTDALTASLGARIATN